MLQKSSLLERNALIRKHMSKWCSGSQMKKLILNDNRYILHYWSYIIIYSRSTIPRLQRLQSSLSNKRTLANTFFKAKCKYIHHWLLIEMLKLVIDKSSEVIRKHFFAKHDGPYHERRRSCATVSIQQIVFSTAQKV